MLRAIRESDWKVFRQLRQVALERFCERALSEIVQVASTDDKSSHERYLTAFRLIRRRDEELADAFDSPRRSTALEQLACIQSHGLLTDEEMARFSPEARESVRLLMELMRT